jgi:hypothetical protein
VAVILSVPSVRAVSDPSWGGMTASGPHSPVARGGALSEALAGRLDEESAGTLTGALPLTLGELVAGSGVTRATDDGAGEAQPAATPTVSTQLPMTERA